MNIKAFKANLFIFSAFFAFAFGPLFAPAHFPQEVKEVGQFYFKNTEPLWKSDARAYIARSLIMDLDPDIKYMNERAAWEEKTFGSKFSSSYWHNLYYLNSSLTVLKTPLEDPNRTDLEKEIAVDTTGKDPRFPRNEEVIDALGEGWASITVRALQDYAKSAKIITDPLLMSPNLFHYLVNEKEWLNMETPLGHLMGRGFKPEEWGLERGADGFNPADWPLKFLACGLCHSHNGMIFVEEKTPDQGAYKLREGDLSNQAPTTFLSVPGMDFRSWRTELWPRGVFDQNLRLTESGRNIIRKFYTSAWKTVLASAVLQEIDYICSMALGLGAFLPNQKNPSAKDPLPVDTCNKIATIVFETLCEVLTWQDFRGHFRGIFLNPNAYSGQLGEVLNRPKFKNLPIQCVDQDVLLQAVEFSKAQVPCGLVNASAAHVLWGQADLGNHFKTYGEAAEELIAAVSTMLVGSRHMSWVYQDRKRIMSWMRAVGKDDKSTWGQDVTPKIPKTGKIVARKKTSGPTVVDDSLRKRVQDGIESWAVDWPDMFAAYSTYGWNYPGRDLVYESYPYEKTISDRLAIPPNTDLSGGRFLVLGSKSSARGFEELDKIVKAGLAADPKKTVEIVFSEVFKKPLALAQLIASGRRVLIAHSDSDQTQGVLVDSNFLVRDWSWNAVGSQLMAARKLAFEALAESYARASGNFTMTAKALPEQGESCPMLDYMFGRKTSKELGNTDFWDGRIEYIFKSVAHLTGPHQFLFHERKDRFMVNGILYEIGKV